jgi:MFS family permease
LYYIPFYFSSVQSASPIQTGVDLFPLTFTFIPATIVVSRMITRLNRFRWALWIGWLTTTLGCGLTVLWGIHTPTAAWVVIGIVLGTGHGFVLNSQNFATQAICLPHDEAAAAAMYAFLRSFGMAFGVGIGSSIFQNVMLIKLKQLSLPLELAQMSESYVEVLRNLPPSQAEYKMNVLRAYEYGFRGVFGVLTGISGLAGLLSLMIGGRFDDLNKELQSGHTLQPSDMLRRIQRDDGAGKRRSQQQVQSTATEMSRSVES